MKRTHLSVASTIVLLMSSFAPAQGQVAAAKAEPELALTSTPITYSFKTVDYPGDTFTQLLGINNSGVIAGYHGSGASGSPNQGFTLTLPSTFTAENYPGAAQTQVTGINDAGLTAGFYVDTKGITHGFYLHGTAFRTADFPGTTFNQLLSLNNDGLAAGYWQDAHGIFHGYLWGINRYIESIQQLLAGSLQVTSSNTVGGIVGFTVDTAQNSHGFYVINGGNATLNYPGATSTQALGVNDSNVIVGTYTDASANTHGFRWTATTGFQSIDNPNGVGTTVINGINNAGTIVGFYGNTAGGVSHGFVGTP